MTSKSLTNAAAVTLFWYAVLAASAVYAQPQVAVEKPALCTLNIEGHSIVSLSLLRDAPLTGGGPPGFTLEKFERPGKSLSLPAGRYRVAEVRLDGDYVVQPSPWQDDDWVEVVPGQPAQMVVGAPLSPQVTVTRHGRFLEMNYSVVDAAGRSYSLERRDGQRPAAPRFTVTKDGEMFGSGSFEYG